MQNHGGSGEVKEFSESAASNNVTMRLEQLQRIQATISGLKEKDRAVMMTDESIVCERLLQESSYPVAQTSSNVQQATSNAQLISNAKISFVNNTAADNTLDDDDLLDISQLAPTIKAIDKEHVDAMASMLVATVEARMEAMEAKMLAMEAALVAKMHEQSSIMDFIGAMLASRPSMATANDQRGANRGGEANGDGDAVGHILTSLTKLNSRRKF